MIRRRVIPAASAFMAILFTQTVQAHDHVVPHVHPHGEAVGWTMDLNAAVVAGLIATGAAVAISKAMRPGGPRFRRQSD